jgi:hypothetical protein
MSTAEERMQDAIDELEQENRLLRARNDRLERESEMRRLALIDTLKESTVQEPIGSLHVDTLALIPTLRHPDGGAKLWPAHKAKYDNSYVLVYTTPPAAKQWIGLSDDAKLDLISDAKGIGGRVRSDAQLFVLLDMQEAKLKEKNL